jgi:hypothetical protein
MTVSIPLIVLVAIVTYIAYRHMGLRAWHAIVCMILGFLLAATSAAPQIRSLLSGILQWLHKP